MEFACVAISYYKAIFVVRNSYNRQKAQDIVGLVLFCCLYIVVRVLRGIFELRSCILTYFSKNRVRTYVISFFAKLGDYVEKFESSQYSPIIAKDKKSTIFKKTREVVIRLIENGVKYFKAGGAIGFNTKAVYSC